ncbi:hypothetical protein ACQEVM_37580 [Streptomyces sp. CA-243310]|uniref:hypothetical protein n=1 Tax=Streptomyces sp. CA-243310 TaxID=3240056 RepID=UPI003D94CD7F
MNTSVMLAGAFKDLGDSFIGTLAGWTDDGIKVALAVIVLITIARKMSMKAAIGALIAMVLALAIYASQNDLSGKVTDEIKNPSKSAGPVTVVVSPPGGSSGGVL